MGHLRRCDDIIQLKTRILVEFNDVGGLALEPIPGRLVPTLPIDLPDLLDHLKKTRSAGDAKGLEPSAHGQADHAVRALQIGHDQIGRQWIQTPFHALHGGIVGLQVNAHIG